MLKWKTRTTTQIKNNDFVIDSVDFEKHQTSNRSMVTYIILVSLLVWAFWKQDIYSMGKSSVQQRADLM